MNLLHLLDLSLIGRDGETALELQAESFTFGYGMTETLMTLSNPYIGERRPGTVGFPLPGIAVDSGERGCRWI